MQPITASHDLSASWTRKHQPCVDDSVIVDVSKPGFHAQNPLPGASSPKATPKKSPRRKIWEAGDAQGGVDLATPPPLYLPNSP